MTDTWAIDGTKANEEAALSPYDRQMRNMNRRMLRRMFNNSNNIFDFGYEEPTEEDRETWRDCADKERVFWADQYGLLFLKPAGPEWGIASLHRNQDKKCLGCDFEGMESEPPEWPCRTVRYLCKWDAEYSPKFYSAPLREKKFPAGKSPYITFPINHGLQEFGK